MNVSTNVSRRGFLSLASAGTLAALSACAKGQKKPSQQTTADTRDLTKYENLAIKMDAWNYDETNDVWWQNGLQYCLTPATKTYERLAIYVPGPFFKGEKNGKTYKCTINAEAQVGNFKASEAPVVMPLNPVTFTGQSAPTAYSFNGLAPYLSAGFIYVYVGFRGRNNGYDSDTNALFVGGAPWSVTDLKAAIRYLRYNAESLPGDLEKIVPFGAGSSGALACILGATGNSSLYDDYLATLGAATYDAKGNNLSDGVYAVRAWSPTLAPLGCDGAYEWYCGQYAQNDTRSEGTWTAALSGDLSRAYAENLNSLGLTNDGTALTLENTAGGIYADGSYYRYLLGLVEEAASAFLSTTAFPYTPNNSSLRLGGFPGDGNLKADEADVIAKAAAGDDDAKTTPITYNTRNDYIKALNSDYTWIKFNELTNKATITDLGAFISHVRAAAVGVCAYDGLSSATIFNQLFGNADNDALHFDGMVLSKLTENQNTYEQLTGWDASIIETWRADLEQTDALKNTTVHRMQMSDPLYYLSGNYEGFGKAKVAPYWEIQTGLFQNKVSFTSEANLAAALKAYDGVKQVTLTPVWGEGLSMNELGTDPIEGFVAWVTAGFKK